MKNTTGIVIGIIVIILVIAGVWAYQKNGTNNELDTNGSTGKSGGNLYVSVTDATADIQNVNDIDLSVKKVEIHSKEEGWVTISSKEKVYALLALKASGRVELYAKKTGLEAGTYDKVRITLGNSVVHTKTKGDVKAVIPGSQVVINTRLKINNGADSHFKIDFMADKSLHATSDGKFVFAPVVQVESRSNAQINVGSDDMVQVSGGTVDTNTTIGVDLSGSSRVNYQLQTDSSLKINSETNSQTTFILQGKNFTADTSIDQENQLDKNGSVDANLDSIINLTY